MAVVSLSVTLIWCCGLADFSSMLRKAMMKFLRIVSIVVSRLKELFTLTELCCCVLTG